MNKRLWILYAGITLAMVGYGIAMPLLPFYLETLGGSGSHLGLLVASYGLMQLFFAPLWGRLSDTHGRKPFLLIGMAGLASGMIMMGLASRLWMLYAAQFLSGSMSCAIYPSALAMISDKVTKEHRSAAIGRIGAAAGLGVILGPGIGGLLSFHSLAAPFFTAAALCLATFLLIYWQLPESLPAESRRRHEPSSPVARPFGFLQGLAGPMAFGLIAAFAANFGKSSFTSVYGFFSLTKFGYGPREVGMLLMLMSLMYALAQGVLVGPLTKRWEEASLIRLIFPAIGLSFLMLVLATGTVTLVLSVSLFMLLMALLKPLALAVIAQNASESSGSAMGLAESFMSLGRIIGPLWAGMAFDINLHLPYFSGFFFFTLLFLFCLTRKLSPRVSSS